ncbi:MAG: tetratricopeptide repeat protein [Bacteroidales bacterium]|nr:tetratricopeptide repeat protein [Bacteroidales bacterium]
MLKKIIVISLCVFLFACCTTSKKTAISKPENYKENALIIDAVTEFNKGNINKSESLFKNVLANNKNSATSMYYLSCIYMQKEDYSKAIDYSKHAVGTDDDNIWYKLQLCELYAAIQDYDKCAEVLEKIVKQQPETLEYWQQLSLIYHVKQDTKKELSVLDRMEEKFGVNETTSLQKFQLYRELNDIKKAEQEMLKLHENFPTQSRYLSILAEMKMKEKDYDKALYYYNKVREIDPEEENLNVTFANYYMIKGDQDSTFYYLNNAMKQKNIDTQSKIRIVYSVYGKDVDTNDKTFERFFSCLQAAETVDTNDCSLYALLNTGYMKKRDFFSAVNTGVASIEKGCTDYNLFQNTLFAMSNFDMPDGVISVADKAIENYPEQPIPYLFKGINQEIKGEYKDAVETFNLGISVAGNDEVVLEDLYRNLGDCYNELGDREKCFSFYDKVLKINADNLPVLNNYAYYLALEKKDLKRALSMIEKVMIIQPDNDTYIDTYAWVLFNLGEYSKAKQAMEAISSPQNSWSDTLKEHYKLILQKAE